MSWNIFCTVGCPKRRSHHLLKAIKYFCTKYNPETIRGISEEIKKINPQILGLQEVPKGKNPATSFISSFNNLDNEYYAQDNNLLKYGNALLTKEKPVKINHEELPSRLGKRSLIISDMGKYVVMNTHLAAHKSGKKKRQKQIKYICKNITDSPLIIIGDFNCEDSELKLFEEAGLKNIISEATYPSYNPAHHFDKIFISKHFSVIESGRIESKFSDHFPVYAKLGLKE